MIRLRNRSIGLVTLANLGVYPFPVGTRERKDNAIVGMIIIGPVLVLAEEIAVIVLNQRVRIADGPCLNDRRQIVENGLSPATG